MTLFLDLRVAMRGLRRAPLQTTFAMAVMGMGLGMVLLLFNAMHSLFWKDLPFPQSAQLMGVEATSMAGTLDVINLHNARSLSTVADVGLCRWLSDRSLASDKGSIWLAGAQVNSDYFRVLRLRPLLGRFFDEGEDRGAWAERPVILTEGIWRKYFGADPTIVGRQLSVDHELLRVVGVAPGHDKLPHVSAECLLEPLTWKQSDPKSDLVYTHRALLRLHPGKSPAAALAALGNDASREPRVFRLRPLRQMLAPQEPGAFLLLLGAAGLLLLLTCANVAGLFLARALDRTREEALRSALGGRFGETLKRHFMEALLVSAGGLGLAFLLEHLGRPLVLELLPELSKLGPSMLRLGPALGGTAILLMLLVALGIAGLPALQATRLDLARTLSEGSASATRSRRWSALLVGAQTALVLVLLIGATLLTRSLAKAMSMDPGFPIQGVLVATLRTPRGTLDIAWAEEVHQAAHAISGVQAVASAGNPPFLPGESQTFDLPTGAVTVRHQHLGPGALALLGIPLLQGRAFAPNEGRDVALLSVKAARALFGTESPLGRIYAERFTVIGVVADARMAGLDQPAPAVAYLGQGFFPRTLLVRTHLPAPSYGALLSERLKAIGSRATLDQVIPLKELAFGTVKARLRLPLVAGAFALTGLLLAAFGLAASLTALLAQRKRELALRHALGASPARLTASLLGAILRPVLLGCLVGAALSQVSTRLLQSQLFGVTANDPGAILLAVMTLMTTALTTTLGPALRAARVQPAETLRSE